ncbi:hypothetical protein [Sphingomonas sp.]|uniref:hypothetical protein n=1 Tax=Sphingomonas sp. TaxID=28214 RepID=UPI001B013BE7|nr:hypothetical protein [Sphingomonas sp.]MBO9712930.1 hypothetical protein [Sphingomonas sp.]
MKLLLAACALGAAAPAQAQAWLDDSTEFWRLGPAGIVARGPNSCTTDLGRDGYDRNGEWTAVDMSLVQLPDDRTALLFEGDGLLAPNGRPRRDFTLTFFKRDNGAKVPASAHYPLRLSVDRNARAWIVLDAKQRNELENAPGIDLTPAGQDGSFHVEHEVRAVQMRTLRRCMSEAQRADRGSGKPMVTPPKPLVPVAALIFMEDYPPDALWKEVSGRVSYRLTLSAKGLVTDCTSKLMGAPVKDYDLVIDTCNILSARARYVPALDADGKPTQGQVDGVVSWQL